MGISFPVSAKPGLGNANTSRCGRYAVEVRQEYLDVEWLVEYAIGEQRAVSRGHQAAEQQDWDSAGGLAGAERMDNIRPG
jgi:hypothetical protein